MVGRLPRRTLHFVLTETVQKFKEAGLDTPDLDARLLVQAATGMHQEDLLFNSNRLIAYFESEILKKMVQRRLLREPVSRILGVRSFWKSEFKVSRETLDPRADSETLIEAALKYIHKDTPLNILDLGTGTGCLLLSLLEEFPQAKGVGIDISEGAIQTAQKNAEVLHLSGRFLFMTIDWSKLTMKNPFDIVISNPPYISKEELATLDPEVSLYDPRQALDGGADGLDCYRDIAALLPQVLTKEGYIFLEIGRTQAEAVREILAGHGFAVLETLQDLAGHNRCIVARRNLK